MVLLISGISLDKCPEYLNQFYELSSHLTDGAVKFASTCPENVDSARNLYVGTAEYAIVYDGDTSVDTVVTDTIGNTVVIILRSNTSSSTLVCCAGHLSTSDLDLMISNLNSTSNLQMSMIGAYQSEAVALSILATMHFSSHHIEMVSLAIGTAGSGVGVNGKTGVSFPAKFSDKGPDMDLRTARTLAGGQQVGMLNIYNSITEELTIGPFSYSPMRAVDIWLQMPDQFLLDTLCPSPEAVEDPGQHVSLLKAALTLIKNHPYPSVTIFRQNIPRTYSRDHYSGGWVSHSWTGQVQECRDQTYQACSYQASMTGHGTVQQDCFTWQNMVYY